ncbi:MAG: ABC transporter ATP-binding protein [Microbacteriaceae bacterium]
MNDAIALHGLTVTRGKKDVVSDLTLTLPRGKIIGLLGPSGAGKTTVMRVIMGVQAKTKGDALVLGEPAGSPDLSVRVSYDTQASSVFDDLTVVQNLDFAHRILNVPATRVADVIDQVGLTDQARQKVGSLSGGQRSRTSLAVALLGEPDVIVLDEPTVGLDPVLRSELWTLFRTLADGGTTLVISSHVMDEAERCDIIVFVRDGRIIANDTLPAILAATKTSTAEDVFLVLARGENR